MSAIEASNKSTLKQRNAQIFKNLFICSTFLRSIDPTISDNEILPSVSDPEEVIFRNVRLIVKDVFLSGPLLPPTSITQINKHVLQRSIVDLAVEYTVVEVKMEDVIDIINKKLDFLTRPHTVSKRRNQDLILKVDMRNSRLLSSANCPSLTVFESMGWRSISLLVDRLALVLYTSERAPSWLRSNKQRFFATPQISGLSET